jgi:hypothetical protein
LRNRGHIYADPQQPLRRWQFRRNLPKSSPVVLAMKSRGPRPGLGWIVSGVLLICFAGVANAARNPEGTLGKTGLGEWAQRKGPVPTKPTRTTDNGTQLFLYSIIAGTLCIAGGVALLVKGNKGGWDL